MLTPGGSASAGDLGGGGSDFIEFSCGGSGIVMSILFRFVKLESGDASAIGFPDNFNFTRLVNPDSGETFVI